MPSIAGQTDLVQYAPLMRWTPRVGDVVIWHGWFTHWYGVVSAIQPSGQLSIIKSGLPVSLFTMDQDAMQKSMVRIHYTKIQASRGGEWTIQQADGTQSIWFV